MTSDKSEVFADECSGSGEYVLSSGEHKDISVQGTTFGEKRIKCSVRDDGYCFEGDICVAPGGEADGNARHIEVTSLFALPTPRGIGITGVGFRWPRGLIPYEIDTGVPPVTRTDIMAAITHWEQNTHIRFVQRTTANQAQWPNYVRFIVGSGCSSFAGMRPGGQDISMAAGCRVGQAIHEIGHAVGLWHEQSREDRDRFVKVNVANIIPSEIHNFNQHISDGDDIGTYDLQSIMHYDSFAFSANGQPTIVTISGGLITRTSVLSQGDIAAVRALYPHWHNKFLVHSDIRTWESRVGFNPLTVNGYDLVTSGGFWGQRRRRHLPRREKWGE